MWRRHLTACLTAEQRSGSREGGDRNWNIFGHPFSLPVTSNHSRSRYHLPVTVMPSISRALPRLLSFPPPLRSLNGGWGRGERGTSLPLPPHFPTPSPPCHLPSLPHQGNEIKASASSFIPSPSSTLSLTSNNLQESSNSRHKEY